MTFFRIVETVRRPLDRWEQVLGAVQTQPATETNSRVMGQEERKEVTENKGDDKNDASAGYAIELERSKGEGDDLDDEFERY